MRTRRARTLAPGLIGLLSLALVWASLAAPAHGQDLGAGRATRILAIHREVLPDLVRVTIELDGEVTYRSKPLENPPRLFFDLAQVDAVPSLRNATLSFDDSVLRGIRLGRHPNLTTRVVLDLDQMSGYSVFTPRNPDRLVIDLVRPQRVPPESRVTESVGAEQAEQPAQPETPDDFVELRVLGGPNAFCPPELRPLENVLDLFDAQADNIRTVLRQAFDDLDSQEVDAVIEDVFRAVERFDGEVQQYEQGTEFSWMAVRRDGEPGLIRPVRWVGSESMPGFEVVVRSGDRVHTFVIPIACCNIALLRSCAVPLPPLVEVELCPSCLGSPVTVTASAGRTADPEIRVTVTLTRPDGTTRNLSATGELEWKGTLADSGTYTVTAVAVNDCGSSEEVTRTFQVPDAEDIRPSLEVTLSGDERGNRVRVTAAAGSQLARRIIGESVRPANARERIDQLLEEASLEITVTADGQGDTPVTLSDAQRTATGIRWDRTFDLGAPGRYVVTAAVKTEGGVCEVTTSFDFRPPGCVMSIGEPIPISDGRARVWIDMCASTGAQSGSHTVEIRRDGEVLRTLTLSACREELVLDEPGLYTFTAVTADSRGIRSTNRCEAQVAWQPARGVWPFVSGSVGLERRWRTNVDGDVSAALVGASGGVMFPVAERLGLFGRVGGVFNTRDTVFSSLFADVGLDVLVGNGFVGAGVGIWDFTHAQWVDGSMFFHGGVDTPWVIANGTVQWFVEGRLFLDKLGMIDNNYSGFTGLRMIWKGQEQER